MPDCKRIVLVTNEILGLVRTGGAGTANTFLSFALAGLGHSVEILFTNARTAGDLDPTWAREYRERGITLRLLTQPDRVRPETIAVSYAVQDALRPDPPHVVIADDQGGPAYAAVRLRELHLGFSETIFTIYCHGTAAWIYDAHRKVRRTPGSFELEALERATIEMADSVVSPSEYMLGWMRDRGWRFRQAHVAPYLTRSAISATRAVPPAPRGKVERLVFFGRLEDRKGLAPFLEALNGLEPMLLRDVELVFLGRETPLWPVERVRAGLSDDVKSALSVLRFEADLDQPEALALLNRSGTLAVMPSLLDNSPNVIYECLEHGIPFLASSAGGGPELIAPDDRPRALVEPTTKSIQAGLRRLLGRSEPRLPIRPGFDSEHIMGTWQEVLGSSPMPQSSQLAGGKVSAIVRAPEGARGVERTLAALDKQTRLPDHIEVLVEERSVHRATTGEFVLLLHAGDEPDPDCLEALLRAQASGADVATCGIRSRDRGVQLFLGEARELGLIANHYGLVGLYRRSLLEHAAAIPVKGGDTDWLMLASLSLGGARIVSVPLGLVQSMRLPGTAAGDPIGSGAALDVVRAFERKCPPELRTLPWLVASAAARDVEAPPSPSIVKRIRWVYEHEGAASVARRGVLSVLRLLPRSPSPAENGAGVEIDGYTELPHQAGSPRVERGPAIRRG